jgi:hypothetical protein
MRVLRVLLRCFAYLWALPYTLFGVSAGLVMLCCGGRVRWCHGAAEFHGGALARWFTRLPRPVRFDAITLGHTILALDESTLECWRHHEHVHVAQYERWGIFFVPAYALSSLWQLACGRCAYRDNHFEKQACAVDVPPTDAVPSGKNAA